VHGGEKIKLVRFQLEIQLTDPPPSNDHTVGPQKRDERKCQVSQISDDLGHLRNVNGNILGENHISTILIQV
jgi:hypothetical protein